MKEFGIFMVEWIHGLGSNWIIDIDLVDPQCDQVIRVHRHKYISCERKE